MHLALFSFVVAALSVQQAVSLPFDKRDTSINDNDILQFALTLEYIEDAFYTVALEKFNESNFTSARHSSLSFQRFKEIAQHEKDHVALLTAILGDQATKPCKYNFPLTDFKSLILLSQMFEDVGASAYAGAIPLLSNPANSIVAASILSIEARQATWVSAVLDDDVPWGSSFQTPLTMNQSYSAASAFITPNSCPSSNPNMSLIPFPALDIANAFPEPEIIPGENATVNAPSSATFIAFLFGLSPIFVPILDGTVLVPGNLSGQVYAIATSNGTELFDNNTIAGPAILLFEKFSNESLIN